MLARLVSVLALLGIASGCGDDEADDGSNGQGSCGDGSVDSGEQCDDGNRADGDGCSASCQTEEGGAVCGNSEVEEGETCDDGNTVAGDGCSDTCQSESPCGNGTTDDGEQCDDGNTTDGDGCSATCQLEGPCGNGILESGEACDDGNTTAGDGCEPSCQHTPVPETVCEMLQPLAMGTCEVTAGDASRLIVGTVLVPGMIYRGGQVLVDAMGKIACVGCDCDQQAAGATKVTCPTGVISPGLINTHDHITFAHNPPYDDTGERYEHRHDWRLGKNGHTEINSAGGASPDQIRWGELRFVLGGATSTVGSGSASGFLRNLDRSEKEGLNQGTVHFETFPLGDSNGTQISLGCDYPEIDTSDSIANDDAYLPHIAEGIDAFARNEFKCASSASDGGQDLAQQQSAFIHSVGLTAIDYATMAADGTAVIWSPRSNVTLYGDTAVVTQAARLGALIALGTDWMPTGSMNMLRELACADQLNATYYSGFFTDEQLWLMVTRGAAEATATQEAIGTLEVGLEADIAIFDAATNADHRAILSGEPTDVVLVLRGGKPLYGDDAVVGALTTDTCDALDVCGRAKSVCVQSEAGKNLAALQASVGSLYPAFFCGEPMNEPSCVPTRPEGKNGSTVYTGVPSATDADGDAIPDAMDNCPTIFNPVRPVDDGAQADFDADGEGDACDICPLNADTSSCSSVDPGDSDADGVPNAMDNCPDVPNAGQDDEDMDDKGDACDACPMQANPGNAPCQATVYEIKDGTVPLGTNVALQSLVCTGAYSSGFFLQVKQGDPGYAGTDFSGVFVYSPGHMAQAGDRVTISDAVVEDFFGQIQLNNAAVAIDSSMNEAPPAPVVVTAAEVATGGPKAAALESVIIEIANVSVTDIAPPAGPGDMAPTNEFVVNGSLRVNDLLYLITPFPTVGASFDALRGILNWRNDDSKLELRSASDVVGGTPVLVGFGPAQSWAALGQMDAPTFPLALTVQLSSAPANDTFVTVVSGAPGSLGVTGGGVTVPAGQSSVVVLVSGLLQTPNVTLTASLGPVSLMANVRVVDPSEVPVIASLEPAAATVPVGGTKTFTVTLDIPAPAGGSTVDLALAPANAGTVPAQVTVAAGQVAATFDYVDSSTVASATVTATLGPSSDQATITIGSVGQGLVINEVDYDQVMTDADEFIEIFNGTASPVSLAGLELVLLNGSTNADYAVIDLSPAGTLPAGGYLVVKSGTVVTMGAPLVITFGAATNNLQNGAPDGVALVDATAGTILDALSYEGGMTSCTIPSVGSMQTLVEGTQLPANVADSNTAAGSLSRLPNGADTDNSATDWDFTSTPTPGVANVP
jgi:cysteine-rich repeat protein